MNITRTDFTENHRGLTLHGSLRASLTAVTFHNNEALREGGAGGALAFANDGAPAQLALEQCVFEGNKVKARPCALPYFANHLRPWSTYQGAPNEGHPGGPLGASC